MSHVTENTHTLFIRALLKPAAVVYSLMMVNCISLQDDPALVSVLLDVEEKNWYKLHAATYVQVLL